jgi:hypothetical protein
LIEKLQNDMIDSQTEGGSQSFNIYEENKSCAVSKGSGEEILKNKTEQHIRTKSLGGRAEIISSY